MVADYQTEKASTGGLEKVTRSYTSCQRTVSPGRVTPLVGASSDPQEGGRFHLCSGHRAGLLVRSLGKSCAEDNRIGVSFSHGFLSLSLKINKEYPQVRIKERINFPRGGQCL